MGRGLRGEDVGRGAQLRAREGGLDAQEARDRERGDPGVPPRGTRRERSSRREKQSVPVGDAMS